LENAPGKAKGRPRETGVEIALDELSQEVENGERGWNLCRAVAAESKDLTQSAATRILKVAKVYCSIA
jgi:hypothetical protein